jgi:hypothetical protein
MNYKGKIRKGEKMPICSVISMGLNFPQIPSQVPEQAQRQKT